MLRPLLVLVVLAVAALSHAGVEKTAFVCDQKVCLRWWPRVSPPAGWSQDREQSANYNFCAFAPEGQSFANAVAVMYANAISRRAYLKPDHCGSSSIRISNDFAPTPRG